MLLSEFHPKPQTAKPKAAGPQVLKKKAENQGSEGPVRVLPNSYLVPEINLTKSPVTWRASGDGKVKVKSRSRARTGQGGGTDQGVEGRAAYSQNCEQGGVFFDHAGATLAFTRGGLVLPVRVLNGV